ncbi:type IV conjugative transfer system coupling protein TraD [Pseudoduganella lurida]|uniref:Type IV conjugative transfer system coupling protein TraD n=1 Tax=Pseudoduganella lurida TaxID=1036180 RepID=A0A562RL17_9BURK|nr:type IV secretion system DNA-binding domain-containing protein [Pseudoduganella lurida]TWI69304.1 type IV conjugative transfer system coupling protein TraD [Pseudoduganella lurida]
MGFLRHGRRQDLIRGAEIVRHEYGLYVAAMRFSVAMACVAFIGVMVFCAYQFLTPQQRAVLLARTSAHIHVWRDAPTTPVRLPVLGDRMRRVAAVPSATLLALTAQEGSQIRSTLLGCAALGTVAAAAVLLGTHAAWRRQGQRAAEDIVIRGAVFVEPSVVRRTLERDGKASAVRFAGVPLERGCEVLNTMITGTVGTGKSVAIGEALSGVRSGGQKVIVFDPTGEYVERFYREGRDVILNPFDQRSPRWTPWNEVRRPYDFGNVAEGFLPVMNQKEPFWEMGAQIVLEDVMSRLARQGKATNRALVEAINIMSLEEIQDLVKKLPASVYMDPEAARTALSIRMNVVRAGKAVRFLEDGAASSQFSIRDWVTDAKQDSWLFLSAREDMLVTMRPLITAWMDIALRAVMSLPPSIERVIWNVIDELSALDRIPCLQQVATRGRKYGVASIIGYQNFAQLKRVYGSDDAQTIASTCQNVLTLRVPDFATAEHVAKSLSTQEVLEKSENLSFGKDPTRDGVTITSRRTTRQLVLPAEIQGLPKFHGYLRLAGRNDVMKVAFAYQDYPRIAAPFLEREIVSYDLDE